MKNIKGFKNYFCRVCSIYRINAGLTQLDVAKMCNKSMSTVCRYEQGITNSIDIFMWYVVRFNINVRKEYLKYIWKEGATHAKKE